MDLDKSRGRTAGKARTWKWIAPLESLRRGDSKAVRYIGSGRLKCPVEPCKYELAQVNRSACRTAGPEQLNIRRKFA